MDRTCICIDLKSYYASVECAARGLDPLKDLLLVADESRSDQTICLAVSPALKAMGVPARPRLFEAKQAINLYDALHHTKTKYYIACPRMAEYERISAQIFSIYLQFAAQEDIHIYSIDEAFIDCTKYLNRYQTAAERRGVSAARFMAGEIIGEVLSQTNITATVGIGTNLYLAKVAMDIVAKKALPDQNGARIAELDERSYRRLLWDHRPLTDFWQIGPGTARRLMDAKLFTMGDIARCSLDRNGIRQLYKLLGKNAELLIDHAWGIEPTTIADVKEYKPDNNSISTGQVLKEPTDHETTRLIVWEMADALSLDLVEKGIVTDQLVLTIGYDRVSLSSGNYTGETTFDYYGREVPKHAHGTINIDHKTSSCKTITNAVMELYERIINKKLLVRRINLTAEDTVNEEDYKNAKKFEQIDFFGEYTKKEVQRQEEETEKSLQKTVLDIKSKYGKNAVFKGMNLEKAGTTIERNNQIGGHKS